MDREHVKGAADKAKGAIKDAAGKVTGDKELQAEGKLDKAKGSAQQRCRRCKRRVAQSNEGRLIPPPIKMSRPLWAALFLQRSLRHTKRSFCLWRLRPNTPYALPGKNGIVRTVPYPFRMTIIADPNILPKSSLVLIFSL